MNAREINRLTKNYGKSRGISDLDLTVERGEFFGFIGPNGAGKSTTIRAMLGLLKPTSGSVSVLGMNSRELTSILSRIGYLPSENTYYPGMRVRDVLKLSAALHKTDSVGEAERLCDILQLDTSKKASELSYGNRKKLSIVCALAHSPELLILDEPTGGLDPLMQNAFFDILREKNSQGTTVFFSSHILSEVQNNCTRTAVIKEGRIIACDCVDKLKAANVKRIRFTGNAPLDNLTGIRNFETDGKTVSFLFSGDMNSLISILAEGTIEDLEIHEPDLEETFMHYYEEV